MRLWFNPASPFARKVRVVAREAGLTGRIEEINTLVNPVKPNAELARENPLVKIPALATPDQGTLYDSAVICEYLDTLHRGPKLFPSEPPAKWTALRRHALGDGLLELLILWRNERERSHPADAYLQAFRAKFDATLDRLDEDAENLADTPFGIGHVAIGCGLSYADFRFLDLDWRGGHPRIAGWHATFSARPSVRATQAREG